MERIKIKIKTYYYEQYIPPRCRKPRFRKETGDIAVSVRSVSCDEAPIAFRLSDYSHKVENNTEIRFYKGKCYKRTMKRYIDAREWYTPVCCAEITSCLRPYMTYTTDRTKEYCINAYRDEAKKHLFIDGEVWQQCGEPRYKINTFGLGHNHGGTGLFVDHNYNPNISSRNYFSALDGDKAVAYANEVARRRGDTKDVGKFEKMIEVLMPECVKVKPRKQHGDGDPFINKLKAICEPSSSALEAGLMVMAAL